jgi:hypothetical protein
MLTAADQRRRCRDAVAAVLFLLFTAPAEAQVKCPPLPEGTTCGHYHYHILVWQPQERTYREVSGVRKYVSLEACDKAKTQSAKENQTLAEFMKASVDSAFQPDQFRDCHCDRTTDPSSGVFLDTAARIAQMRIEQEAAWTTRERLLSSDHPKAGESLRMLFGREVHTDRFLRKTFPPRLPERSAPPATATLLDTRVGGPADTPPIAANLSFIEIPLPGGATAPPAENTVPAASGDADPARGFFLYELARADAILTASDQISEEEMKSIVRREVVRRKRVIENLRTITRACDADGPTMRALRVANDEAARLAVIRGLFGDTVVRAWAPTDARGAAATTAISADAKAALVFDAAADVALRRASLYATLGQERQLSEAETNTFVTVLEELISK